MTSGGVAAEDYFSVAASLTQIDMILLGRLGASVVNTVARVRGEIILPRSEGP